jgi:hypothetical protein
MPGTSFSHRINYRSVVPIIGSSWLYIRIKDGKPVPGSLLSQSDLDSYESFYLWTKLLVSSPQVEIRSSRTAPIEFGVRRDGENGERDDDDDEV